MGEGGLTQVVSTQANVCLRCFASPQIADTSAIPIQIYNFPGIANGLDLSLPLIQSLAPHPNIVGVKLSCGNVGKGACLSASFPQSQFAVLGGLADTLLHGLLASGSSGAVTGLANIAPRACVKVYNLFKEGKIEEARKAQLALSLAGGIEVGGGIPGMRVSLFLGGAGDHLFAW